MQIIFAGTPATAIPALEALAQEHQIIGVFTRAPAPKGRKKILTNSPVHDYALQQGYPVYTPKTLKDPQIETLLRELAPAAVAVVAYGLLIPENLLQIPTHGWLNLHYSLLPRWRGAAPVQAAIAAGDAQIGTCVFQIEKGLDTGPVFDQQSFVRDPNLTASEMLTYLSETGAAQLRKVFAQLATGSAQSTAQSGEITYAPMLQSNVAQINWAQNAHNVQNQIHAYLAEPGSWSELAQTRIKIGAVKVVPAAAQENHNAAPGQIFLVGKKVQVATSDGALELSLVAPAGKKWMNASDWFRGIRSENPRFSSPESTVDLPAAECGNKKVSPKTTGSATETEG